MRKITLKYIVNCEEKYLGVIWDFLKDRFKFKTDIRPFAKRSRGQKDGSPWTDRDPVKIFDMLRSKPFSRRSLASLHGSFFDLLTQVKNSSLNPVYKLGQREIMSRFAKEDKVFGFTGKGTVKDTVFATWEHRIKKS